MRLCNALKWVRAESKHWAKQRRKPAEVVSNCRKVLKLLDLVEELHPPLAPEKLLRERVRLHLSQEYKVINVPTQNSSTLVPPHAYGRIKSKFYMMVTECSTTILRKLNCCETSTSIFLAPPPRRFGALTCTQPCMALRGCRTLINLSPCRRPEKPFGLALGRMGLAPPASVLSGIYQPRHYGLPPRFLQRSGLP
jgi:hypothetical protein